MAVEFSRHRNILARIEQMVTRVKAYEHDIEINKKIDPYWYLQKAEELRELQSQIDKAAFRLHELRLTFHKESHIMYLKLKADDHTLKKVLAKRKNMTRII